MAPSVPPSSIEARLAALEISLGLAPSGDGTSPPSRDIHSRIDLLLSKAGESKRRRQQQPPGDGSGAGGGGGRASTASSAAHPSTAHLEDDLAACDRLSLDLDPGPALTRQGAASGSDRTLLYRRQEVLASVDTLRAGLAGLGTVRDLLLAASAASGSATASAPPVPAPVAGGKRGGGAGRASAASKSRGPAAGGGGGRQVSMERIVGSPLITSERYGYACDPEAIRRLRAVSVRVVDVGRRASDVASRADDIVARYYKVMAAVSEKMVLADEDLVARGM